MNTSAPVHVRTDPAMGPRPRRGRMVVLGVAALLFAASCSSGSADSTDPADPTNADATEVAEVADSTDLADTNVRPETTGAAAIGVTPGLTAITVPSTPEQYFVLSVRPDLSADVEIPVSITRGTAGTTTLTDGRAQLPEAHYRVEPFPVSSPGDVDGDGVDDLTELADPAHANPLNPAPAMDIGTGALLIPDRATFETLSYQGDEVARDGYLAGLEFVKFWLVDTDTAHPSVYFMNTETYRAHPMFAGAVGILGGRGPAPGKMRGDIVYDADATAPDGTKGTYRFAFQPNDAYPFAEIALAYELLASSMPVLRNNLLYHPLENAALPLYESEKAAYDAYRVPVLVP